MLIDVGGTDGLMCLLCSFRFGGVLTYLVILLTVLFVDLRFGGANGQPRQVDRVGTHIGDLT